MKQLQLLLILCVTLLNSILCQDWKIIEPDRYYNYSLDSIIRIVINIESQKNINLDYYEKY